MRLTTRLTRQHFRAIAETIKKLPLQETHICSSPAESDALRALLAAHFASTLAQFNPAFRRHQFIEACHRSQAEY